MLSLFRPVLFVTIVAAAPAVAQQSKSATQGTERPASTGTTKPAFMVNVQAEFAQIDVNKDGKATKEEIKRHRTKAVVQRRQAANRAAFARLDTDKNGSLSPAEFAAAVSAPPNLNVDPLVTKLDANKDGNVTWTEFQAGASADFTKLDANKDGILMPSEVRSANQRSSR